MIWKSWVRKWPSLCNDNSSLFLPQESVLPRPRNSSLPLCVRYISNVSSWKLFYSWQKVTNDVGYLNITFLHIKRGRILCKCSWCRLSSFPFYHSGREEIMWNVFNYLHALSWFKITQGCVSYILILVNSLILLPHVIDQLTEPHN